MNLDQRIVAAAIGVGLAVALPARGAEAPWQAPAEMPDAAIAARAQDLLAHMTLAHKIGQLIMPDIAAITPADMQAYRFGAILNGGNSAPGGNLQAPPAAWLALADAYWRASTAPLPAGEPAVPALWAIDGVHGDNHIGGGTIFPHNVALGAAGDPVLARRIGTATAAEIAVLGLDWTFAPTLAISRDVRWGRSYESFSEDPRLVTALGVAEIEGLQGVKGTPEFLDQRHVLATAKHFLADGGTAGKDEGDTRGDLAAIITLHGQPYPPAIAAGAQTVMASFSSINGTKMHGNAALLTGLLRGQMGFDGLVVGDWNAHGQVPGCSNGDCPQALLAGLDMYMVPNDWRALAAALLREVRDGTIPLARIDEAVSRILRVKLRYGLFDKPMPSRRVLAGQWGEIGSPAHRALAREAVARSLVLLKNRGVLPIKASARVLVAGAGADSIARQAGGWTIDWQGGDRWRNRDFPGATSIGAGIAAAMRAAGGHAEIAADGRYARRPDVAVVVFGEPAYAEYAGDRPDHALHDEAGLRLLRRFRAAHIPTVAVLLAGRPLWLNREIDAADAFVAAWLPGSEGAGVADVLVGDTHGAARRDFTGRLPFHWPADCTDSGAPLLPTGAGGSYAHAPIVAAHLPEGCAVLAASAGPVDWLFNRAAGAGVVAFVRENGGVWPLADLRGAGAHLSAVGVDRAAQEDARALRWTGPAELILRKEGRAAMPAGGDLVFDVMLAAPPAGHVAVGGIDLTPALTLAAGKGWRTLRVPLRCLAGGAAQGIAFRADAPVTMRVAAIGLRRMGAGGDCTGGL